MKKKGIVLNSKDFTLLEVCECKSEITKIIKCSVKPNIEKLEVINIKEGINTQGWRYEKKRLVTLVNFSIYAKYSSSDNRLAIYEDEKKFFLNIDSPEFVDGVNIMELHRKEKINLEVFIDKLLYKKTDRKIFDLKIFTRVDLLNL